MRCHFENVFSSEAHLCIGLERLERLDCAPMSCQSGREGDQV